jgi:hypothetical protein
MKKGTFYALYNLQGLLGRTVYTKYLFNHILHTAWLDNHALTLKRNSAKYYYITFAWLNYHTYLKKQRGNLYGSGTFTCKTIIPNPRV